MYPLVSENLSPTLHGLVNTARCPVMQCYSAAPLLDRLKAEAPPPSPISKKRRGEPATPRALSSDITMFLVGVQSPAIFPNNPIYHHPTVSPTLPTSPNRNKIHFISIPEILGSTKIPPCDIHTSSQCRLYYFIYRSQYTLVELEG